MYKVTIKYKNVTEIWQMDKKCLQNISEELSDENNPWLIIENNCNPRHIYRKSEIYKIEYEEIKE